MPGPIRRVPQRRRGDRGCKSRRLCRVKIAPPFGVDITTIHRPSLTLVARCIRRGSTITKAATTIPCAVWARRGPAIARADSATPLVVTAPVEAIGLSCESSNCRGDFNRGSLEGSTRDPPCGRSACHRQVPTTPYRPCRSDGDGAIQDAALLCGLWAG